MPHRWLIVAAMLPLGCRSAEAPVEGPSAAAESEAESVPFGRFRIVGEGLHLGIHAALMRDSTVFYFAGSQNEPTRVLGNANYAVWDPRTETSERVEGPEFDMFCSGHAHLPDGRLLIAGGNEYYPPPWELGHDDDKHFTGLRGTYVYDYRDRTFVRTADMALGRWYPTVVRGPGSGHGMLVLEGHPENSQVSHENVTIESIDTQASSEWTNAGIFDAYAYGYYPRAHLLANNELFIASPREDQRNVSYVLRATGGLLAVDRGPAQLSDLSYADWTTATVLLPYRLQAKGGYRRGDVLRVNGLEPWVKRLDEGESATWRPTGSRPPAADGGAPPLRKHGHAILLPSGEVFVVGGVVDPVNDGWHGSKDTSVYHTEIYEPSTDTWTRGPSSPMSLGYHSNALLLADGRVWVSGGNKRATGSITNQPNGDGRDLRFALFEPWYHDRPDRPLIHGVELVGPRGLRIDTDRSWSITEVVLMAPGSATHAFDVDQRAVYVPITGRTDGSIHAVIPDDAPLPSGDYLVFVATPAHGAPGPVLPSRGAWVTVP